MERLRHHDLKILSESLLELYSPGPHADFPARVSAILARSLSFDCLAYHEIVDGQSQRTVFSPEIPFDTEAFTTYLDQHPTWSAFTRDHGESCMKISDFLSRAKWERTDLYNHIFRPLGFHYQLGFVDGALPQLGIGLNRSRRDFTEEERTILDLLQPHLTQAFGTSQLFSYFADASHAASEGYLVADGMGRIRFCTPKAARWLDEYFGHRQSSSLPDQVRGWLKGRDFTSIDSANLPIPSRKFSVHRAQKRLVVESLSPVQTADHRLVLHEKNEELKAAPLEALDLTKREAEVLLWVSEGKRNAEIGTILGITAKTVAKHVEKIFEKLGVESRTSAASLAHQTLCAT
jgi:DNA-binding CsgD family transcriptional regulator